MIDSTPLPHDRRGFVHKRLLGAAGGFITGGFGGAAGGFFAGGRGSRAAPAPVALSGAHAAQHATGSARTQAGHREHGHTSLLNIATPGGGPCPGIFSVRGPGGTCINLGDAAPGGDPLVTQRLEGGGEVVMGRYGAGMVPLVEARRHLDCLPGMVLGTDEICYNRRDLKNAERKYPKGRAPLLTGGERNAISKANRAAKKIERTTKQLQSMGMMKKPNRSVRHRTQTRLLPSHTGPSIINVE